LLSLSLAHGPFSAAQARLKKQRTHLKRAALYTSRINLFEIIFWDHESAYIQKDIREAGLYAQEINIYREGIYNVAGDLGSLLGNSKGTADVGGKWEREFCLLARRDILLDVGIL